MTSRSHRSARAQWLFTWVQHRRRKRARSGVRDLAVIFRDASGFQLSWSPADDTTYQAFYRVHGDADWIDLGIVANGFAAVDIPNATLHSFEMNLVSTSDGRPSVDSNLVQTVNDSLLPAAPAITD